jgi:hypothetical protein
LVVEQQMSWILASLPYLIGDNLGSSMCEGQWVIYTTGNYLQSKIIHDAFIAKPIRFTI